MSEIILVVSPAASTDFLAEVGRQSCTYAGQGRSTEGRWPPRTARRTYLRRAEDYDNLDGAQQERRPGCVIPANKSERRFEEMEQRYSVTAECQQENSQNSLIIGRWRLGRRRAAADV